LNPPGYFQFLGLVKSVYLKMYGMRFTTTRYGKSYGKSFLNLSFFIILFFLFPIINNGQSVKLNGTSQYGNAGNAASLHLSSFTLEAWIKIDGSGTTTSTGTGGITNAVPIITKGRAETDGTPAKEVNYFLGYQPSTNKLVADFEDNVNGTNHPVSSTGTISTCTWTHVAATYNVSANTWKLYINGVLNKTLNLGTTIYTPELRSNMNTGIGTSFNSTSAVAGFFNGRVDEVRIWNIVRTDADILANYNAELTSGTGLVARWGLNEGSGSVVANSISGGPSISLTGSPAWMDGFSQSSSDKSYLQFDGTDDYVNFGQYLSTASGGPLTKGTIEFWFKAKTLDANDQYLLSLTKSGASYDGELRCYIDGPTNNIVFTIECTGPATTHTIKSGSTAITAGAWYHVALVWESDVANSMKMFVNGVQTGSSLTPACGMLIADQNLNIGRSNSTPSNSYFDGYMDELRIWNIARTAGDIQANMNAEITSGSGLRGRWGFNSNCGTTATNSVSGGLSGTLVNGVVWVAGTPGIPTTPVNIAPNQPTNPSPANNTTASSTNPSICADISDPDGGTLRARFYGRPKATAGQKFTVIVLPDTQFYTAEPQGTSGGNNAMFKAQTKWIADNRQSMNIVYVGQLGDCTNNGDDPPGSDNTIEWRRSDTALKTIESPALTGLAEGIPYGVSVGNHDQSPNGSASGTTNYYNQYFGEVRFNGRSYYGGHYGSNNDNFYDLFSASGIDFLVISMEYNTSPDAAVLDWAANLVQTYSNRKVIVMTHYGIDESTAFGTQGLAIYNRLKVFPNFILFTCGHIHQTDGEARRSDVFNGNTVHTLLSDYQGRAGGGNGLLRIYEFDPSTNKLSAKTYSPYLGTYETDSDSQFQLDINLSANTNNFTLLGELPAITSGTNACINWPNLLPLTSYEWYVELYDGVNTTVGPVWTFTTPSNLLLRADPMNITTEPEHRIEVYPNPARGNSFNIQLNNSGNGKVNVLVYDMNGKLQLQKQYNGGSTIQVDHRLTPGVYIVKIQTQGRTENRKLVIQ
jgi:Concanavalin A-like lectin/glucanases superfamily/Secretion system C-terminal sorting domain/Calcineurin-like phosphoesterase